MGRKDIAKDGIKTQFKKGNKPKGHRRKNKLADFKTQNNLSSNDISNVIKNVIAGKTEEEIKKLINDKDADMLVRTIARLYVEDFRTGKLYNLEKFFNRAVGMPKQTIDENITLKDYTIIAADPYDKDTDPDLHPELKNNSVKNSDDNS